MQEFILETELWLPRPLEEVFRFFAEARNLKAFTRRGGGFEEPTPGPITMDCGTLIDYRTPDVYYDARRGGETGERRRGYFGM